MIMNVIQTCLLTMTHYRTIARTLLVDAREKVAVTRLWNLNKVSEVQIQPAYIPGSLA